MQLDIDAEVLPSLNSLGAVSWGDAVQRDLRRLATEVQASEAALQAEFPAALAFRGKFALVGSAGNPDRSFQCQNDGYDNYSWNQIG